MAIKSGEIKIPKPPALLETFTGRLVDVQNPSADAILLEDIAHSLSNLCRFNGHTKRFYSVAEHSILLARAMARDGYPPEIELLALLHDAPEAYVGDVPVPLRGFSLDLLEIEMALWFFIMHQFNIELPDEEVLAMHAYDERIRVDEMEQLFNNGVERTGKWEKLGVSVACLSPEQAEQCFLQKFTSLQEKITDAVFIEKPY